MLSTYPECLERRFLGGVNDALVRNSCSLTALGQGQFRLNYQEAKVRKSGARGADCEAVALFLKEVERLNREEATQAKYRLTLEDRLLNWCAQQKPPVARLSELDVETMRPWIHSWPGAPTTRHNQHRRVITFFFSCMEQDG